jgi:hypothetical protein
MCEACESDEPYEAPAAVPPEILDRARAIEAALAGERAPDQAWAIYLGHAGGALPWPHYQRIRASLAAAYAAAPVRMTSSFRKRPAPIRCEGVRLSAPQEVGVVR